VASKPLHTQNPRVNDKKADFPGGQIYQGADRRLVKEFIIGKELINHPHKTLGN
jgi:hypothetical protein